MLSVNALNGYQLETAANLDKLSQSQLRQLFRQYSQRILRQVNHADVTFNIGVSHALHLARIRIAVALIQFGLTEPLSGALSDWLYQCWYDVPTVGEKLLVELKPYLANTQIRTIQACINKEQRLAKVNTLASRWSVLTSATLATFKHSMRCSADDSKQLAKQVVLALRQTDMSPVAITEIEEEFFAHCVTCNDVLSFSIVWWQLNKQNWQFDERWYACQQRLS